MTTSATTTHKLELDDACIAYDVRGSGDDSDHTAVLVIGQPMCADGFAALADELAHDRMVITYDPRGLGRSTRSDGSKVNDPKLQAADLHALISHLSMGPVDIFASSGGAVTGLALVAAHPADVRTLVAHEPPIFGVLPDAEHVAAAVEACDQAYADRGFGAGMATFIRLVMQEGELTADFLAQPAPDPAQFGLPTEDDGARDDVLLGGTSRPVTAFMPDVDTLRAASTRIVVAGGINSQTVVTGRAADELAKLLDQDDVTLFRGGHGGFAADEWGQPGDPGAFADQLRDVLDD